MKNLIGGLGICVIIALSGCAGIDFGKEGLVYYDPKPYLFVSTTKDCVTTATVIAIPTERRSMRFNSGYGSADLSAAFTNGMIASVGQNTDTKIPDTINSIASLAPAVGIANMSPQVDKQVICRPTAKLYEVVSGSPAVKDAFDFPVTKEIVDLGARR